MWLTWLQKRLGAVPGTDVAPRADQVGEGDALMVSSIPRLPKDAKCPRRLDARASCSCSDWQYSLRVWSPAPRSASMAFPPTPIWPSSSRVPPSGSTARQRRRLVAVVAARGHRALAHLDARFARRGPRSSWNGASRGVPSPARWIRPGGRVRRSTTRPRGHAGGCDSSAPTGTRRRRESERGRLAAEAEHSHGSCGRSPCTE